MKTSLTDYIYRGSGTLLGIAAFTVAPFLVFMWVGFEAPALVLVPLAMYLCFKLGKEVYDLAEQAESGYEEAMQNVVALVAVLVVLGAIGFEVYDWLVK